MAPELPATYKKLVVSKLTTDFRQAVSVVTEKLPQLGDQDVLVKIGYVGINATDINVSAGRYTGNKPLPFDVGFEAVGEVVAVGSKVTTVKVGQKVACFGMGAYAEYFVVPEASAHVIDEAKPEYIAILASGLTAAIGLDKSARITEGETVLITAAAGGTGHIAVQWAKAAGCHVIGTCSSEKKMKALKSLGCDRVINYKTEDLDSILSKEYPKGVNVVWETVGGKVFETCLRHLSVKGRLLVIGAITGYKGDKTIPDVDLSGLPGLLLSRSAAVQGFFLPQFQECYKTYFVYLRDRTVNGELRIMLDDGKESTGQEFHGLEGVISAVEHLHSGTSMGKVIARIC